MPELETQRSTVEYARRAEGYVGINGVNVWGDIKEFVSEIEFDEVASGETDSFEITMDDKNFHWINDWLIDKYTKLNAKIKLLNWLEPGDEIWIDCGEFLCDGISIKGFPIRVTIKALALPLTGTKNSKKWEKIALSAIAQEIAGHLGCELKYYASDVVIETQKQSRQTDIDFLFKLCNEYGLGMKIYKNSIVIFDRQAQDAAPAADTYNIKDFAFDAQSHFSIEDNEEGTYTGAQVTFKPEGSDSDVTYSYGTSERVIMLDTSVKTMQEAELKCRAALYNANVERVKLSINTMGGLKPIYPGTNYNFTGIGAYSGKYAIERVTHTMTGEKAYHTKIIAHAVDIEKDK